MDIVGLIDEKLDQYPQFSFCIFANTIELTQPTDVSQSLLRLS